MRIQLINPPSFFRLKAITSLKPGPPLGLAYIAGALRDAGHEVSVVDALAEAPDKYTPMEPFHCVGLLPEEVAERVDPEADVIAISAPWSFAWPLVRQVIAEIKRKFPDKVLVGGGEHLTGLPEYSLREAPLDVIVVGEGEEVAIELFAAIERGERDWSEIEGVAFLKGDEFVATPRRSRIRDVDKIAWPAWDLFDLESYNNHGWTAGVNLGMTVPILATRGCPYECTYCSNPMMWTRFWKERDPVDVVNEIQHYYDRYGARNFPFQDLTAVIKRSWIIAFCEELMRRNLKLRWHFPTGTRCEVIDEEVATLLHKTGCHSMAFAPESGSARTRKLIKKQMTEKSLMDAVRACVKQDLSITIFIVLGFPHDTWSDIRETIRLARKLAFAGADDIGAGFFFPLPATQLYDELVAQGRITLSDEFLYTPIYASAGKLTENCNYCESISARKLTLAKFLIIVNFYAISVVTRPMRFVKVAWNVLRGRETGKLEAYIRNRFLAWFGSLLPGSASKKSRSAEQLDG